MEIALPNFAKMLFILFGGNSLTKKIQKMFSISDGNFLVKEVFCILILTKIALLKTVRILQECSLFLTNFLAKTRIFFVTLLLFYCLLYF